MVTVGIRYTLKRSAATILIAGILFEQTKKEEIPVMPDISVGRIEETGDTKLDIVLDVKSLLLETEQELGSVPQPEPEPEQDPEPEEAIVTQTTSDGCMVYDIPEYPGKKSYMSYTVFKGNSAQYKLQQQAVTDSNGIRVVDGRYCIAIGTRFNAGIGKYVDLVLLNGVVIPCIVGDLKDEADTDKTNTFSLNGCCSEFIIDLTKLDYNCKTRGDMSFLNELWNSPVKQIVVY